jgi:hypothetical protein
MSIPNLRKIFRESRTEHEERRVNNMAFLRFSLFIGWCALGLSWLRALASN